MDELRYEFELNSLKLQYNARVTGIARKYERILGLEIEGIRDILVYMPEEFKPAIEERLARMERIIEEIKEKTI